MLIDEEVYIEHVGVKGMRWGVRRAQNKAARERNRELNKTARAAEQQRHEKKVESARKYFDSGKGKKELEAAKAQYQKDKIEKGSYEARRILKKTKDKQNKIYETASQTKNGKEKAGLILSSLGAIAVGYAGATVLSKAYA